MSALLPPLQACHNWLVVTSCKCNLGLAEQRYGCVPSFNNPQFQQSPVSTILSFNRPYFQQSSAVCILNKKHGVCNFTTHCNEPVTHYQHISRLTTPLISEAGLINIWQRRKKTQHKVGVTWSHLVSCCSSKVRGLISTSCGINANFCCIVWTSEWLLPRQNSTISGYLWFKPRWGYLVFSN